MRNTIILILLGFWCFLAYEAYVRGDRSRAGVYLIVGLALTAYRFGLGRSNPSRLPRSSRDSQPRL